MKTLSIVLVIMLFPCTVFATTIHVPADQPTIQAGIDAAVGGDFVLVSPGTYYENINFSGKNVILKAVAGADWTIIDGGKTGQVVIFNSGESMAAVLDGFTIRNGLGYYGGGVHCDGSSPTIKNCFIMSNEAEAWGGGVYLRDSYAIVRNCIVFHNYAYSMWGGIGILMGSPQVIDCEVIENSSNLGGGIGCGVGSSPTIRNCKVYGNISTHGGGGIDCSDTIALISNCEFYMNQGGEGGGMRCVGSLAEVINCVFLENSADQGGAVYCASDSSLSLVHCTITENSAEQGGGIYCYSLAYPAESEIVNSILWGNVASEGPEIWLGNSIFPAILSVSYCDVQGGEAAAHISDGCVLEYENNIDADPLFVGFLGDYHLQEGSPCIDSGTPVDVYTDIDDEDRPMGFGFDMGADEYNSGYWLELSVTYSGFLNLSYTIGTPEPTLWLAGLVQTNPTAIVPLWTALVGEINPPQASAFSFPLSPQGWVCVYMVLLSEQGLEAMEFVWVDTGE